MYAIDVDHVSVKLFSVPSVDKEDVINESSPQQHFVSSQGLQRLFHMAHKNACISRCALGAHRTALELEVILAFKFEDVGEDDIDHLPYHLRWWLVWVHTVRLLQGRDRTFYSFLVYDVCVQGGNINGGQKTIWLESQALQDVNERGRVLHVGRKLAHVGLQPYVHTFRELLRRGLDATDDRPDTHRVFVGFFEEVDSSSPD